MTTIIRGKLKGNALVDAADDLQGADRALPGRANAHFGIAVRLRRQGARLLHRSATAASTSTRRTPTSRTARSTASTRTARIPKDNPFVGKRRRDAVASAATATATRRASTLNPTTGALWEVEHGPRGGDELNLIRAGHNYGWPVITYGMNYNGTP